MISYLTRGQRKHHTNGIIINFALCNSPNYGRACCECVREISSSFNLKVEQRPIGMDGGSVLQWYHCIAIDFPDTFSAYARTAWAPKTRKWYSLRFICLSYAPIRSLIGFNTTGRFPSFFFLPYASQRCELSHSLLVSYELSSGDRKKNIKSDTLARIYRFLFVQEKHLSRFASHLYSSEMELDNFCTSQTNVRNKWKHVDVFFFFFHFFHSSHSG